MSLFENLAQKAKEIYAEEKLMSDQEFISDAVVFGGDSVGKTKRTPEQLLKSNVGWVYACVDAIATEVASIHFRLFKRKKGGDVEEVEEHDILDLLSRANPYTTKYDLFALSQEYLELVGEAPWFLQFENGKPVNIFLLRPDRLEVKPPSKEGDLIGGYKYRVLKPNGQFEEVTFEPIEILFLKYADPTKPFRGRGTLQSVVQTVAIDEVAEQFNLNFFTNAAVPSSVVGTKKKLKKEVREKLERVLKQKYSGFSNAHKSMILEGEVDFKNLSLTQREMDFINSSKFNMSKILAGFKVPKSVLGMTEQITVSNAEATDKIFAKRTVKPKMTKLAEMLNEFLVPLFEPTGDYFLSFDDPVPENVEQKLKIADGGVKGGWLTPNEAREMFGYDAVEGGDELKTPVSPGTELSIRKVERMRKKHVVNPTAIRAMRKRSYPERRKRKVLEVMEVELGKSLEKVMTSQLIQKRKEAKRLMKNKNKKFDPFAADTPEKSRVLKAGFQMIQLRIGEEFEPMFVNQMNRIFREQEMKVLDQLPKKGIEDIRLDEEFETEFTKKKMTPHVTAVIGKQSEEAFRLIGQSDRLTTRVPAVASYLENRVFRFSKEVTKETNKKLGKTLGKAVEEGVGTKETAKRVKDMFAGFESRSEMIARSEIIRATGFATEESYIQSGVVEAKEWLTFIDENTDAECLELDGKQIPLGDNFFDKGQTTGRINLDYEDIQHPPLHVNCRCTLVPVVVV